MPEFVIEREIPGAGQMTEEQIRDISVRSLEVLKGLGPQIQWLHSYVTDDRIYCVYLAPDEAVIREHARKLGVPANRISAVRRLIDPQRTPERSGHERGAVSIPRIRSSVAVSPSFHASAYASALMRVRACASVRSIFSRSACLAGVADPVAYCRRGARQHDRRFVARLAAGAPGQRLQLTGDAALMAQRRERPGSPP